MEILIGSKTGKMHTQYCDILRLEIIERFVSEAYKRARVCVCVYLLI